MTNSIDETFKNLKTQNKKAQIVFITAGDPTLEKTYDFALGLLEGGADILELGVPFSDPVAEGPTIQASSKRALRNGASLTAVMSLAARLRKQTPKPILLMLYMNCVFTYPAETFFEDAAKSGVDGVIIPDLPFEERADVAAFSEKTNVRNIYLVSPTSGERVKKIAREAKGFLYCVSSLGVTGTRNSFTTDFKSFSENIKSVSAAPTAVGFGISTPAQAKDMSAYFDGVIIGSAYVKLIERAGCGALPEITRLSAAVRAALDSF